MTPYREVYTNMTKEYETPVRTDDVYCSDEIDICHHELPVWQWRKSNTSTIGPETIFRNEQGMHSI